MGRCRGWGVRGIRRRLEGYSGTGVGRAGSPRTFCRLEACTTLGSALSLEEGNREIDKLLRGGVKVTIPDRERGGPRVEVVRVTDWDDAISWMPKYFATLPESFKSWEKSEFHSFGWFHHAVRKAGSVIFFGMRSRKDKCSRVP